MSGTSVDAVDAVLLDYDGTTPNLLATHSHPLPDTLRERIFDLSTGAHESVHALCTLDQELGELFATAVLTLLAGAGTRAEHVHAIGSHGQTVRHQPHRQTAPTYTLQIADPNVIAERTGICTVADFRRRDMAAGGEGAPLVPLFHADVFGAENECRAIINIGGIANATLLAGQQVIAGFDCGPGNTLLDGWIARHQGQRFDTHGAWSAEHSVDETLLDALLADDFFQRDGPRSTGPEHFNLGWLDDRLTDEHEPGDVQATLAELTARSICESLPQEDTSPAAVYICGGGARNTDLMRRLHHHLDSRGIRVGTTGELGIDVEWVEASAFAWLAYRTLAGLAGNAPVVTGARGERVLGGIFTAGS